MTASSSIGEMLQQLLERLDRHERRLVAVEAAARPAPTTTPPPDSAETPAEIPWPKREPAPCAERAAELEARLAEAQAVEERDRAGAHGDDVAEDPTDPRRRALEGLDRRRVVVALDLERDCLALAEVDDARVLARPLQHSRTFSGETLEEEGRVLVAAVLRPEKREDGELEVVRPAREQCLNTVELPVREAERAMQRAVSNGAQEASPTISSLAEGEEGSSSFRF